MSRELLNRARWRSTLGLMLGVVLTGFAIAAAAELFRRR